MTTPPDNPAANANPFEVWKQIYEANERAWNSALERAMASPNFAEAQGKLLETFLHLQRTVREQVRTYLEAVNVPSREDIARLGELIVGLEEKVDQLADRLLDLEAAVQSLADSAAHQGQPGRPAAVAEREGTAAGAPGLPASASPAPAAAARPADGTERRGAQRPSGRGRRARREP